MPHPSEKYNNVFHIILESQKKLPIIELPIILKKLYPSLHFFCTYLSICVLLICLLLICVLLICLILICVLLEGLACSQGVMLNIIRTKNFNHTLHSRKVIGNPCHEMERCIQQHLSYRSYKLLYLRYSILYLEIELH